MRTLAADLGGTKTLLALLEPRGRGRSEPVRSARERSAAHASFDAMLDGFLAGDEGPIDAAVIAVAGPVSQGRATVTNLPFALDEGQLADRLGAPVRLLNDFHAVALGLGELREDELLVLRDGPVDPDGPKVVIGAGTGLGKAVLVPTPAEPRVLASEGGHVAFAARDRTEAALLAHLAMEHGRVSQERVVSGPGLAAIYRFVVEMRRAPAAPEVEARMREEDPAAVIAELGASGADPACALALERFVSLYGAVAGDLALSVLPTGGFYVAGGIAPKIASVLKRGAFLDAFDAKGRMRALMGTFRVSVVRQPEVGLLGAAAEARRMAHRRLTADGER